MAKNSITHICQNCGEYLSGLYCTNCGQKSTVSFDRSLKSILEHFFEEIFVWDSRFFRSVKYLFTRPGYLTQEYISGRVSRYISPLKMFLFTSLIAFFVMIKTDPDSYKELVTKSSVKDDFIKEFILTQQSKSSESKELFIDNFNEQVSDNITIYIFFIMFVFSLLLKIAYSAKNIYYVEHLVFTLHFFTFVLICLLAGALLEYFTGTGTLFFLYIVPTIYLLIALKNTYHKVFWKAALSSILFAFSYWVLVTLWVLGTIFISALRA